MAVWRGHHDSLGRGSETSLNLFSLIMVSLTNARSIPPATKHVEELLDPVFAGAPRVVLGGRDKFAFLQNPDRADVVTGHKGMEWPLLDFDYEDGQGSRRNAPAPELAPDPVAEQPLFLGNPASEVPSHLPVAHDRAGNV